MFESLQAKSTAKSAKARRQELLDAFTSVLDAANALASANARAHALFEEAMCEFGDREARRLFPRVEFVQPAHHATVAKWEVSIRRAMEEGSDAKPCSSLKRHPKSHHQLKSENDLLSVSEVCALFGGITRATLYKGIQKGRFPLPIKFGSRISRWVRSECEASIRTLANERAPKKRD